MKAVITGSSSGIGKAVALKFLQSGWEVVGFDILPSTIRNRHYVHYVSPIGSLELPNLGDFEVLINNAGVQNSSDDIDVNLKDTISFTEHYLLNVTRSILFVTSASAHSGAEFPWYSASKGGLLSYTKNVARRVASRGVTCNSLSPGGVITDLNKPVLNNEVLWNKLMEVTPLRKWMSAEECADWVYFMTAVNKSCTAEDILVDNGENTIPVSTEFIWE